MSRLREMLKRHEGLRLFPYKCTAGKTTVGYGRNLDSVGISEFEANLLLSNDIARVLQQCVDEFPWFNLVPVYVQDVVASMVFQMGMKGFKGFRKTIDHIRFHRYADAAEEMLRSEWASQTPLRARELSKIMKTGNY